MRGGLPGQARVRGGLPGGARVRGGPLRRVRVRGGLVGGARGRGVLVGDGDGDGRLENTEVVPRNVWSSLNVLGNIELNDPGEEEVLDKHYLLLSLIPATSAHEPSTSTCMHVYVSTNT